MAKRIEATSPVTIRAAEGDSPKRFEIAAYTGEPMNIGGYDLPVVVEIASVDVSVQRIPVLYDHMPDVDFIVGQSDSVSKDNGIIRVAGTLNGSGIYAQKVREQAAAGYVWQASIGMDPASVQRVDAGQVADANGRQYAGPLYLAKGGVLREVSFVVLGGDRKTSAVVARRKIKARKLKGSAMSFEEWLLSMGFEDQGGLSEVQKANLKMLYDEEYGDGSDVDEPTNASDETPLEDGEKKMDGEEKPPEEVPTNAGAKRLSIAAKARAEAAREEKRIHAIKAAAKQFNVDEIKVNGKPVPLVAHAIEQGWDATKTELEALRASRGSGPMVITGSSGSNNMLEALQGAVMLRAGMRLDDPIYSRFPRDIREIPSWLRASVNSPERNRIMDRAHDYSDMSLVDICRECLRIDGREAPRNRQHMIRAAMSGGSFSNIFTTNVNAMLLSSYLESSDTTQGWTTTVDVADFKEQERIRVQTGPGLSIRPRGADADHVSYEDQTETYKIDHFASTFSVDLIDIINDSMGAMSDTPQRMGLAAARLRPDLVYAIILANENLAATSRQLFNSTEGNTAAGALDATTLKAAISAMMIQRENGANLNIIPTHILVPPTLMWTAKGLISSQEIVLAGTAGTVTERGSRNVLIDANLQLVSDARLENGVVHPKTKTSYAGSASQWYLASTLAHTIEVAYLRATGRAPEVRSWTYDRDGKFGLGWDVSLAVGAKALDWRGLFRRTG
jgi:hypothetical protein